MLGKLCKKKIEIQNVSLLEQMTQTDVIVLFQQIDITVFGTSALP